MTIKLKKLEKQKKPLSVSLEINNVCNAKCTFCAYGKEKNELGDILIGDNPILDNRPKQHLSKDVFKHTIKLCNDAGSGILKKMSIQPTLGESTVSKNWLDLIKTAKLSKGVRTISSYTNAITLQRFGSDAIIKSGIDSLAISSSLVSKESYKRIYGRDKYEQSFFNILDLLKSNKKHGYPIDIYLNLRIDLPEDEFFKSKQYKELSKYIEDRKISFLKKYDNFGGAIKKEDLPYGASFVSRNNNSKKAPCYQLYRQLMVNVDGTIQACTCRVDKSLWTRNIMEFSTLEAAWKNDKLEKIRGDWKNRGILPKACVFCTHYAPYTQLSGYYSLTPKVKSYIFSFVRGGFIYMIYKKIMKNFGGVGVSYVNEKRVSSGKIHSKL